MPGVPGFAMRRHVLSAGRIAAALALSFMPSPRAAADALTIINHHPLALLYGLPAIDSGELVAPGRSRFDVSYGVANHFAGERHHGEELLLDGETQRLSLSFRHSPVARLEMGIEIPCLSHDGGYLDGPIEDFHDLFGFAQNGRGEITRGRILFSYRRDGAERLRIDRARSGASDIRLRAGYALNEAPGRPLALRASLKLPTGEPADLTGSGASDLALWIVGGCPERLRPFETWCGYGGAGLLMLGKGEVLAQWQRRRVWFGNLGVAWRYSDETTLKAQVDAHSPFFESALGSIGKRALGLALGVVWGRPDSVRWEFLFSEDLAVNSAPDATFLLTVRLPL
jgi:hypothetical protein